MTKYTLLLVLLIACATAQACFKCKPQACTPNGCTDCDDGTMLSSQGWCGLFTPIEGCRIYNASDSSQCTQCTPDRQLINSRCFLKPDNCAISDQFRQCLICNSGFQLFKGNCYSNNIQNCPLGSLPGSLTDSIIPGAVLCQPLRAQNCLQTTPDSNTICLSCNTGYRLLNGRCLNITSSVTCNSNPCACPNGFVFNQTCYRIQIDKCTILRDPVYCIACQLGFVAIDGICVQPVKQDDVNCNVKAPNSDYCTGCNQDYSLNIDSFCYRNFNISETDCPVSSGFFFRQNGICFYKDRRCDSISFSDKSYACLRCQQGFTLKNRLCQRNICIRFSANGVCQQAFLGYVIVGTNQYRRLPVNCLQADSNNNCLQCSQFTRNLSASSAPGSPFVCAYQTNNCSQYNVNGSCIQCVNQNDPDGYTLRGRFCFKKAQNCIQRDSNDQSKCLVCSNNYHLDPTDRICYINITGCEVYLSGSDCKQCQAQNFVLYQKKCYPSNPQCLDYDSNNICRRCSNGLMPFKSRCVYYHPYCLEYGSDRVCSLAANGWTLGTGMTSDQRKYYMDFMVRGEQVTSRSQTVNLNGVSAASSNLAGAYDQGALITRFPYANLIHQKISGVNLLGQISSCNPGFTLINQACIRSVVPNCEQYSVDELCIRCAPQFTLLGDFTCSRGLQCSDQRFITNGRCSQCAKGLILLGIQCFVPGNQQLINQQLQSAMFYKYTYPDGSYFAWPRLANCITQSNPVACSQCQPPYQNVNGQCIIPVDRCVDYGFNFGQSFGICQTCSTGFIYWFGQCRQLMCSFNAARICNSCPTNYYYYFGICLSNPIGNCRASQNATCVQCNNGFFLNLQNQCQVAVTDCLTTNVDTGRCLECRSGLVLYRQRCVREIRYCVDYNNNNICTRCQKNTINNTQLMRDGTCAFIQGQCAQVDQQTRQCSQCNLGYTGITQDNRILCVIFRANCRTYDIRGRCTQCNPRFVLMNNQCRAFLLYCLTSNSDGSKCTKCTSEATLDESGCCKVNDANCINYSQCQCTACLTRFFLNPQGLCQRNPTGCDVYDFTSQKCRTCSAGYYLLINGTCILRSDATNGCMPEFSLTYDPVNGFRCQRCIQGFQLGNDGLCYAYNCLVYHPTSRQCINCPVYYKIYQQNNLVNLAYCIPYFCELYIPGKDICQTNTTTYFGGHIIISVNKTVTITYCTAVDNTNGRCVLCSNFRYPNLNTQYSLCYPLNCRNNQQFDCLNCNFGFQLNPQFPGSCVASFCQDWKIDGTCQTCRAPYTLSSSGICQNRGCCQQYDAVQNICRTPKKYFTIQGSICVPVNCLQPDLSKLIQCAKCAVGYTLFPDGTCRVTNCLMQTFSGQSCISCNKGYQLRFLLGSAKTICVPRNCTQITDDLNTCLKCREGFTLNSDKLCEANYCSIFKDDLTCSQCIDYFALNSDLTCRADCSIGGVSRCQCCKFGFSLNLATGLCQPSNTFCASLNSNTGLCRRCVQNYIILSGTCIAPVPNCKTPSMLGCVQCNAGYQVLDNCRCSPRFCIQVNPDGKCSQCHPRFELTAEGLCKPRDCQSFSVQTWACNNCYSRFTFQNGMCVTSNCQIWQDFQNTTCKQCSIASSLSNSDFSQSVTITFNLTHGACYINFCVNDPRQLFCKQCIPGFNVTLNGLCQCAKYDSNRMCMCPDGYILDSKTGGCVVNLDVCLERNSQTGVCNQCPYLYQPPFFTKGQCVVLYCSKWQQVAPRYMECQACFTYFDLVNGFCQSNLCLAYKNVSGYLLPQCTTCKQGFTPLSNFCIPNRCQASTFNISTGLCSRCTSFGYVLTPDKTRCVVANCKTILPNGQCAQCLVGYFNFTKLCIASNCTIFDQVTCKGCLQGWFYLKDGLCYAYNCQIYGSNNFCSKCVEGFTLASNFTCIRKNCEVDTKDKCLQCSRGFSYNEGLKKCTPVNCQNFNPTYDDCDKCISGYYVQNGTCIDIFCDPNSFTYDYKCLKCQNGYQFNANNICWPSNTDFCPPGRYYNNDQGACVNIPTNNCLTFVNNKCMRCADGFILYKNLCYSIRFCRSYSYFVGCLSCVQGYYLDPPQCSQIIQDPNCLQTSSIQCVKCKTGYQLISGRCFLIPINCTQIDSNGRCVKCAPGFIPTNRTGVCTSSDPNCLFFNNNGRCAQCVTGYYNLQGICQQNPPNCINVDLNGRCTQCAKGYDLQNGLCYLSYQFCTKYSVDTQFCIQCTSNFTLLGIQCKCNVDSQFILNQYCIKLPPNCLEVSPSTFVCIRCARNFVLGADFRCVSQNNPNPPANCKVYNPQTGICSSCLPNFILTNNNLCQACPSGTTQVGNQCFTIIIGCLDYLSNGQCKTCASGYILQNSVCVINNPPANCNIYDPQTGICSQCFPNFILTSNNLCQACPAGTSQVGNQCFTIIIGCLDYLSNGQCKTCIQGYKLQGLSCVKVDPPANCRVYDPQTGICSSCFPNFILTSNNLCQACPSGTTQVGNQCFTIIIGCLDYLSNGQCKTCASGYILQNLLCVKVTPPPFCEVYDPLTGVCQKCVPGYSLTSANVCQKQQLPQFCSQYNFTTSLCVQCAPGYQLTADSKLCVLTNCELMNPSGLSCNRCRPPFQWNGQFCVFATDFCNGYGGGFCVNCTVWSRLDRNRCVPSNCLKYNYNTGICQSCNNGYTLLFKRCFTIIVYCKSYSESGTCLGCEDGYIVSNNGLSCSQSTVVVPNCFAQSIRSCLRCQHRYYLNSTMCSAYLPYCINIDPTGRCISCCFGSRLVNGQCQRDSTIKYCSNQVGRSCIQCMNGYRYCDFCDSCLPQSPNCLRYSTSGACLSCVADFILANGVCLAPPVGFVSGALGTCRNGYYLKNGTCYRNPSDLKSYSSTSSPIQLPLSASYFILKQNSALIIFSIVITTRGTLANNAIFLLYYRSKVNDPFVCWNSCVPKSINNQNYVRQLAYPIIATQINLYILGQNIQNVSIDFRILA